MFFRFTGFLLGERFVIFSILGIGWDNIYVMGIYGFIFRRLVGGEFGKVGVFCEVESFVVLF